MATVYGRKTSSNVQIVMWAAAEVGLEVERKDVGGQFGGTDTSEYRAMNPNGLVPAFKDGDLVLFESAAIARYIGAKYGNETYWPTDPVRRAEIDVWAEWTKSTLYPVLLSQVFWTLIRTPKAERNMENFTVQVEKLDTLMTMLENRLEGRTYIGGDDFTFADILTGHLLYRYFTLDFTRKELPNVKAYYDRLQKREAYREHVMVDYSSLKVE